MRARPQWAPRRLGRRFHGSFSLRCSTPARYARLRGTAQRKALPCRYGKKGRTGHERMARNHIQRTHKRTYKGCPVGGTTLGNASPHFPQPQRGFILWGGFNPVGVVNMSPASPRVARASQPWAKSRSPVGANNCRGLGRLHWISRNRSQAARGLVDELPREAFGESSLLALSQGRDGSKAGASSPYSKRFAQFGGGIAVPCINASFP
jgi:hypothetical protein